MNRLHELLRTHPLHARVVPFVLFAGLTMLQGKLGPASVFWVYVLKTLFGVLLVALIYPAVAEMRYKISPAAVGVGIGVFILWVGLDDACRWLGFKDSYPKMSNSAGPWNPHEAFGLNNGLAWMCVVVRILGSSLVVPCLEETFYRSFIYRYCVKADFLSVPFHYFAWTPFLATAAIFGFAHFEWLAGILCAFAYQGLAIWKNRLGDAMTAHAITNFLLGLWVVWRGAWHFW
jgi:uncharacterized protein